MTGFELIPVKSNKRKTLETFFIALGLWAALNAAIALGASHDVAEEECGTGSWLPYVAPGATAGCLLKKRDGK